MQKYIHLVQIVETEKVAANQLRTQLEDQDTEIERLKSEVRGLCLLVVPSTFRTRQWNLNKSDIFHIFLSFHLSIYLSIDVSGVHSHPCGFALCVFLAADECV